MKKQGYTGVIVHFLRSALLIDAILAVIVGLVSFALGFRTLEAYGTLLIWTGMGLILISCIIGVGSFASRTEDVAAFSLSRAGNMSENLKQIAESSRSSFGCFLQLLVAGFGLVALGYLLPVIGLLMG